MKKVLIIGHSHINALQRGWDALRPNYPDIHSVFVNLRGPTEQGEAKSPRASSINEQWLQRQLDVGMDDPDLVLLSIRGNQHSITALSRQSLDDKYKARLQSDLIEWLDILVPRYRSSTILIVPPPPPVESSQHLLDNPGVFKDLFTQAPPAAAEIRLEAWTIQCDVYSNVAKRYHIDVMRLPTDALSANGFLAEDCWSANPTHANQIFGRRVMMSALKALKDSDTPKRPATSPRHSDNHPYLDLPDYCFWKQSVSDLAGDDVDPVISPATKINQEDKVATAGSCFAQHISKRLRNSGFNFYIAETPADTAADPAQKGYEDFSARYGNIYTARQLNQLFDRAFGTFTPIDRWWPRKGGGYCDPFRPRIEPDGFPSPEDVLADQQRHLSSVRNMFETLDVFVFTLGLTECFISQLDGAAYPLAPGVAGGRFDPSKHAFVNFSVNDIVADFTSFSKKLRLVNPRSRIILTVSPVPLVATYERRHVLVSSTLSKSILRVAADHLEKTVPDLMYFPSYEIITGNHSEGRYFGRDRRSVKEVGVDHVMRLFMKHMTVTENNSSLGAPASKNQNDTGIDAEWVERLAEAECDEESLGRS